MRLGRVLTVLLAAATVSVALASPAAAEDYIYPPAESTITVAPIFDPLRPFRSLVDSDVSLNELASIGAIAVNTGSITDALDTTAISWTAPSYSIKYVIDSLSYIEGYCTYGRTSAGVESGGTITFTVAGEATAVGRYKGAEIVATGLQCDLYKPDMTISTGAQFAPGSAVAATTSRSSVNAAGGMVCTEVWALFRTVPRGESSALKSFGRVCH